MVRGEIGSPGFHLPTREQDLPATVGEGQIEILRSRIALNCKEEELKVWRESWRRCADPSVLDKVF